MPPEIKLFKADSGFSAGLAADLEGGDVFASEVAIAD